jgi:hypothetical protein
MATVEYNLIINASPEIVYNLSQDCSVRCLQDPFL